MTNRVKPFSGSNLCPLSCPGAGLAVADGQAASLFSIATHFNAGDALFAVGQDQFTTLETVGG